MNKDQIKGAGRDLAGKAQEKMGEMTGSAKDQAKGLGKQAEGKVQKGVGDVKDSAHDATKDNR